MDVKVPVYGLSMFPLYLPGDEVRLISIDISKVQKGDVVSFVRNSGVVLHRVVNVKPAIKKVTTKGDGLIDKDEQINFSDIEGLVVEHTRNGKDLHFSERKKVKTFMAFLSPVMGCVFYYTSRLWYKLTN